MRLRGLVAALALTAATAGAQPAPQRMLDDAEAPRYAGVGRLNVAGNRHCTATLVDAQRVLTAAHCLYNMRTGRRAAPAEIRFVAGQRRDEYAALRGAVAAATLPGFVYRPGEEPPPWAIALDLALVMLDAPVEPDEAAPFPTGALARGPGHSVVGYGRDRAYAASIREGCTVVGIEDRVAALDCAVTAGVSGAPVFVEGPSGPVVAAVVSAMTRGENGADGVALVVPVSEAMQELAAALAAEAPAVAR